MRKLVLFAFLLLLLGFILSLASVFIPGAADAIGGFFGGILGGTAAVIVDSVMGLMNWGAANFTQATAVLIGTMFTTAVVWIILTRAFWPRIKNIYSTATPSTPIIHQTQPSMQIPTQTQPATQTVTKQEEPE